MKSRWIDKKKGKKGIKLRDGKRWYIKKGFVCISLSHIIGALYMCIKDIIPFKFPFRFLIKKEKSNEKCVENVWKMRLLAKWVTVTFSCFLYQKKNLNIKPGKSLALYFFTWSFPIFLFPSSPHSSTHQKVINRLWAI